MKETAFSRNIGLITEEQQTRLTQAHVLVCGTGGMGGVATEVMARTGIGHFTLADPDTFEASNFNRQIHSNLDTVGRYKVEVLAEAIKNIHPEATVSVETNGVTEKTIDALLEGVDIVVNGMDQMRASIMMERAARQRDIPIVDAWITPFASVFVMQKDDPHWEEFLDMPTRGVPIEELDEPICTEALLQEAKYTLSFGDPQNYVKRELVEDILAQRKPRPSLAPVVWLSGTLMANEVFKYLLGYPVSDYRGVMYDQYQHRLLTREENQLV